MGKGAFIEDLSVNLTERQQVLLRVSLQIKLFVTELADKHG